MPITGEQFVPTGQAVPVKQTSPDVNDRPWSHMIGIKEPPQDRHNDATR